MSCTAWNDRLIGRLYGELDADEAAALAAHLEQCAGCRESLDDFRRVRTVLRDDAQEGPAPPRFMVLNVPRRLGWTALAASMLGASLLAGLLAGVGFTAGRGTASSSAGHTAAIPASTSADTEELVRREVDRRLASMESATAAGSGASGDRTVSPPEMKAELAKLEKRLNGMRAADLEFVLDQIGASEFRTGTRIGKTNDALRTVALASSPYVNEQ